MEAALPAMIHTEPTTRNCSKAEFPAGEYAAYSDKEYALCFTCHKRDLLQFPDTSFATDFRDGERNLHYLHVNKSEKGRSCRMCHNIHWRNQREACCRKHSIRKMEPADQVCKDGNRRQLLSRMS